MANTIKHKRSSSQGAVPTTGSLQLGELAINTYDGLLFFKKDDGTASIVTIGAGGGVSGITTLNGLTSGTQSFVTGTSGADFNISSATATHTFNLPTASASARGALSSADWSTFNNKLGSLNSQTGATQTFAVGTSGTDFAVSSSSNVHTLNLPSASATARGVVTTGTQTIAGQKNFTSLLGVNEASPGAQLQVTSSAAATKGLIIKAAASASANVLEVQNSSSNNLWSVDPSGNVTIAGDLTVNGTTQTVHSTTVTVDDPVFTLGGDTAPTADDNKDRGIEYRWHNGTAAKLGFFGYDDSIAKFTFIPDATNSSEVFSGTQGDVSFNTIQSTVSTGTAPLTVASTTAVTNLNADLLDGYHASTFLTPAGAIMAYGGDAAPSGWYLCQGQALNTYTFATLHAVISNKYGGTAYLAGTTDQPGAVTTFNLPNLQQRFPLGKAASGTGATLGDTGGAIDHTHTVAAHYHGVGTLATGTTGSGHGHGLGTLATGTTGSGHGHGFSLTAASGGEHTHTYTINYNSNTTNTDNSSQTRLKGTDSAGTTRSNTTAIVFNNTGTHSHSVTGSVGGTDGGHTHNVTGTIGGSDGTHTHNVSGSVGATTGSNGDSAITTSTGNPPYLVVNYIIKT